MNDAQKLTSKGIVSEFKGSVALFSVPIGMGIDILGKSCEIAETDTGFIAFPSEGRSVIYLRTIHRELNSGDIRHEYLMIAINMNKKELPEIIDVYSDVDATKNSVVLNGDVLTFRYDDMLITAGDRKARLKVSYDDFCRYEAEEITSQQLVKIAKKAEADAKAAAEEVNKAKKIEAAEIIVELRSEVADLTNSLNDERQKVFTQAGESKKLNQAIQMLKEDKSLLQEKLKDSQADAETSQVHIGALLEQIEGVVTAIKNAWPTYFFGGKKPMTEDLTKAIKGANNTSKGIEKALRGEDWRVC